MRRGRLASGAVAAALALGACGAGPELATVALEAEVGETLFRGVLVFDGEDRVGRRDVLVRDGEIAEVAEAETIDATADAVEIDGSGLTVLPGLVDSHAHLMSAGEKSGTSPSNDAIGRAFLYAGVTTVLVAAGFPGDAELRDAARAGDALAPHLYVANNGVTAPGGHPTSLLRAMLPWPISWFAIRGLGTAANGAEAATRVAADVEANDPDFVKIIYDDLPPGSPHLSRDALEGAIEAARQHGVRPIVHATMPVDAVDAVEAGAALLVHVPQRGLLTLEQARTIVDANVPLVTTLRLLSSSHQLANEGPSDLEREMYSRSMLEAWMAAPAWDLAGFSEEIDQPELRAQATEETATNVRRLLDAGARLFVGTDSGVHGVFPGSALHREMQRLVEVGMMPVDVLRGATSAPAAFIDAEARFGRIAEGWRADLLLVRGDPTADIDAISEIEGVWLSGRRLRRTRVSSR